MPLVDLTTEEIQAQLMLNDLVVRQQGIQVAEPALILSKKLQAAIAPPSPVVSEKAAPHQIKSAAQKRRS